MTSRMHVLVLVVCNPYRQDKTTSFTDAGASTSMSVSLISIHYTVTCFSFRLTQLCNHTTYPDFARICPNVLIIESWKRPENKRGAPATNSLLIFLKLYYAVMENVRYWTDDSLSFAFASHSVDLNCMFELRRAV